jgi:branched-subunit amino acid aminotransferase/4-amino-4-deoxychorismate lyase
MSSRLYRFSGQHLGEIEWCDPARDQVLVADSWRVESGEAVALARHQDRFNASAMSVGLGEEILTTFWVAVRQIIPAEGSWFPRVEVVATPGGPALRYREREAPDWLSNAILAVGATDPRTSPLTKGPDLEALMALRRSVANSGASEALILSPAGVIIEGAYSTVMVWREGRSDLSSVAATWPRIPSVTESVLQDIAQEQGISVVEESLTMADLEGAEVWIISALHGIRRATAIVGGPELASTPGRREAWQELWWQTRTPV